MDEALNNIILYKTEDGKTKIEVKLENETVWLTQAQMAELFQKGVSTIQEHIQNIYDEGELRKDDTLRKSGNSGIGLSKPINLYNLDIIISVGYRVKSHRGTQFRIWATQKLKEYMVKGFVMDDARLENGRVQPRYFDELLERVRRIRASERNFYEKVKDIFATSIDYDSKTENAIAFYSSVQNKFHYAITGQTAAEIVVKRIDGAKDNLGLTNWQGSAPTRQEAKVAKNYLLETELRQLYLLVEQFLAYAELQIERKNPMHMANWNNKLNEFLALNDLVILEGKGKVSHENMEKKVRAEMEKYLNKSPSQQLE